MSPLLDLAAQRSNDAHLIEPAQDSALFYVQQALRLDPGSSAAQEAEQALALRLLTEARGAIDRRDFAHAAALLEAAKGIAAAANVEAAESLLAAARRQADADAWRQLLKNATERLQQDRLIEPANDSAKYYLMTLRGLDPNNAGLAAATVGSWDAAGGQGAAGPGARAVRRGAQLAGRSGRHRLHVARIRVGDGAIWTPPSRGNNSWPTSSPPAS